MVSLYSSCITLIDIITDRMPVILGNRNSIDTWLNGPTSELDTVTSPYEGLDLVRIFLMLNNSASLFSKMASSTGMYDIHYLSLYVIFHYSSQVWHPVTAAMGKPSFDGPECIKEVLILIHFIQDCLKEFFCSTLFLDIWYESPATWILSMKNLGRCLLKTKDHGEEDFAFNAQFNGISFRHYISSKN